MQIGFICFRLGPEMGIFEHDNELQSSIKQGFLSWVTNASLQWACFLEFLEGLKFKETEKNRLHSVQIEQFLLYFTLWTWNFGFNKERQKLSRISWN
jgi:hypothetical protein